MHLCGSEGFLISGTPPVVAMHVFETTFTVAIIPFRWNQKDFSAKSLSALINGVDVRHIHVIHALPGRPLRPTRAHHNGRIANFDFSMPVGILTHIFTGRYLKDVFDKLHLLLDIIYHKIGTYGSIAGARVRFLLFHNLFLQSKPKIQMKNWINPTIGY